jgi:hypothetical protein
MAYFLSVHMIFVFFVDEFWHREGPEEHDSTIASAQGLFTCCTRC